MNTALQFTKELFSQPKWVVLWVNALVVINLASVFYFEYALSQIIFGVFVFQGLAMVFMYAHFGFTKILGMAHILWPFLLFYLFANIGSYSGSYFYYLLVLSVFIIISLLFDVYDVFTYFRD